MTDQFYFPNLDSGESARVVNGMQNEWGQDVERQTVTPPSDQPPEEATHKEMSAGDEFAKRILSRIGDPSRIENYPQWWAERQAFKRYVNQKYGHRVVAGEVLLLPVRSHDVDAGQQREIA